MVTKHMVDMAVKGCLSQHKDKPEHVREYELTKLVHTLIEESIAHGYQTKSKANH